MLRPGTIIAFGTGGQGIVISREEAGDEYQADFYWGETNTIFRWLVKLSDTIVPGTIDCIATRHIDLMVEPNTCGDCGEYAPADDYLCQNCRLTNVSS